MKSNLLFPPVFRIPGIILIVAGLILGYIFIIRDQVISFFDYNHGNFTDEIGATFTVAGLIFAGFSRLKNENKQTIECRLNALYWSVLANLFLVAFAILIEFINSSLKSHLIAEGSSFVFEYDLFILLFIFIIRLSYTINKLNKGKKNRPLYFLPHTPFSQTGKIFSALFLVLITATYVSPKIDSFAKIIPDQIIVLFPVSILFLIGSKDKNEIGVIKKTRLKAMQLAVYIGYGLFLIATWAVYGIGYLIILYSGFVVLPVIFVIVFYCQLYQLKQRRKANTPASL